MAFFAEKVSAEDSIKFNLEEVNNKLHIDLSGSWGIDRDQDIFFRHAHVNHQNSRESADKKQVGVTSKTLESIPIDAAPRCFIHPRSWRVTARRALKI
jgi:hypothetical protein